MLQPKNSTKLFKKVRLKLKIQNNKIIFNLLVLWLMSVCIKCVQCNRPPRFIIEGHSEIVLRLKEGPDTPVGTLIYHLKGFDPDGDQLIFGLRNTPDSDILRIENVGMSDANIILNKELDRETKDEYSIVLTLTDNRLGDNNFITQSLLLLVEDVNDNEPIFKPFQSALEVPENSSPGVLTTVEATDRDEGAYGQVVYYLQELDGDNDIFSISTVQGKGVIRLVGDLDYERKSLYQLRVLAVDRANQGKINTGTAALLVKIKDLEDQPPVFAVVNPVTRIPEDLPKGSKVLQVKAIDGDRGVNNLINYSIINDGNDLFAIDENSGAVYTTKELDREDTNNQANGAYILKILATERSQLKPQPSVKTEVTIIITDINDEKPTFRNEKYECEVNENAQANTPLTFIGETLNEVYDHDQGNNGTFELYIDPPNDMFEVTPSTVVNDANFLIRVKNNGMIDFEKMHFYNFSIVAREVVPDGKFSTVPVYVHIRDTNDNYPEFTKQLYEVYVPENIGVGATIGQVQAVDEDSGNFGTRGIRYTSLGGSIANLLQLNPVSGIITVRSPGGNSFDRELISRHYLTVEARDDIGQGNRNTVQLIVNIDDVNDNPPVFVQQKYEVRLLENKNNFETPLIVEAKDLDLNGTKNSEILYQIVDGEFKDNFTINMKTGVIEPIGEMDFEELSGGLSNIRPLYLTVRAKDSGIPILSARVPIVIYVQDVNDFAPVFQQLNYQKTIPEDLIGGSSIIEIKALDNDGSSPNNLIVYRILNGAGDKFVIDSVTGVISVAPGAVLDPDLTEPKTAEYLLTVLAIDGGFGAQQLSSTVNVKITILDVNNKAPSFTNPGTVEVTENTPVGTYVYRLIANDLDAKPMLRYHLDPNTSEARSEEGSIVKQSEYDYLGAFEINPIDGLIRVVKLIDREKVEQIKLGFSIEDVAAANGRQLASGIITILIEDENDNNPKFRKPFYKRSITENSPNGITIANVVAFDVDKNKTIEYSLAGPQDIIDLVHLDKESGEIVVANRIDHEMYEWLNFTVRATDSGVPARSSLVDVFIQVMDENDNNPYFIGDLTNFTIAENSPIGTRIATIQARDSDSGDYGKITFLMDRTSSNGKFTINADTGVLSVADNIDREIKDSYMIVIEAWDNYQFGYISGESRNAFKQIFITILDVNDSPPKLHVPSGCVQITEYHDIRESIVTVKGSDSDDHNSPNGQLEFMIANGNNNLNLFEVEQIDPWTAKIYAANSLKGHYGNFTINLMAQDLGKPQNVIDTNLEICISDFNDHAPIFTTPSHNVTIRVPENATIGSHVIQVMATDDDIGPNAAVRYRLKHDPIGNYRTFSIDQDSGMITLKRSLDREKQKIYEIRVEAFDQGIPTPLSTDLDLIVYVRNVNEYEPQFLVDEISVNFTEHTKPGIEKMKLPDTVDRDEVDDLDDAPSTVCYYIVYGNEDGLFKLDPESHIITLLKELDREIKPNHTLIIKATENCLEPPKTLTFSKPEALIGSTKLTSLRYKSSPEQFDRFKHSRSLRSVAESVEVFNSLEEESPVYESLYSGVFIPDDSTLVHVVIYVEDINDNSPEFVSKIFTGGVTTTSDFGTEFMSIKAIDTDDGINGKISYYQIGEIQKTLTEGLDNLQKPPFLVNIETGAIQLNFDPQKGMKGYFDFMVLANDTDGLQDISHVFIYLLREDQRVRFVLRQQPPELRDKIHIFRDVLGNVTNVIVNVDEFKVHENKDGSVDKTKTDVYLHLVDKKDNSILDVSDVLRLVDLNIEKLDGLFKDFNVLDTQPAEALLLAGQSRSGNIFVWLVFSNLFICVLLIVVLVLCLSQRTSYKRQLRAARVNSYVKSPSDITSRHTTLGVPNTNKHSTEGSNPIWLKAYANEWFKNDDDLSQNSGQDDSLDENVLANEEYILRPNKQINGLDTQNNLGGPFNVYQQIDKLTSAHILTKKLETTEL